LNTERVPLEASRRSKAADLQECSEPAATERVNATMVLRRRNSAAMQPQLDAILRGEAPPLSREDAAQTLGADPHDIENVKEFAETHGLEVTASSAAERSVRITGTVAQMEAAFGTKLRACKGGGQSYLYYEGALSVPSPLAGAVEAVLGLDQRQVAKSR